MHDFSRPLVHLGLVGASLSLLAACGERAADADAPVPAEVSQPERDPAPVSAPVSTPAPAPAAIAPYTFAHDIDLTALRAEAPVAAPEGCTPITGATTITEPGRYCLTTHIIAEGSNASGLTIAADNVDLDLMGRTVVSTDDDTVRAGIAASGRTNLRVANGAVSGFLVGVRFSDVRNATISELDLSGNQWRGIEASGASIAVENNTVRNLAGHANYTDSEPVAIVVNSATCSVANNSYGAIRPIHWDDETGIRAKDCTVRDNTDLGMPDNYCLPVRRVATLTQPGRYCLKNDITVAQANRDGLSLAADDITLDLGGHTVSGPGGDTRGSGIRADARDRVRVVNGTVRGFNFGVRIDGGEGSSVSDVDLSGNAANRLPR